MAALCHATPRSKACRGGWSRWITATFLSPDSFPEKFSR